MIVSQNVLHSKCEAIGTEYPISSVNRFRFICPSFVRADSNSVWRNFLGAGHYVTDVA